MEATVALAAAGRHPGVSAKDMGAFHGARERCYGVANPDGRAEAFARFHRDWFVKWGLRGRLEGALSHFETLPGALAAIVFRRARTPRDEGVELYSNAGGERRGVFALRPDRLLAEPILVGFLNHELAILADMVSPDYGYLAELGHPGLTPSQERLSRERYRILWAIRADGGLERRGLTGSASRDRRRAEFDKAFGFLPAPRGSVVFEGLWDGTIGTHAGLVRIAVDPRGLGASREIVPGAPCPLCGFPAFAWARAAALRPEAVERIRVEFAEWRPEDPICARCGEIYDAVTGAEYPPTVCLG